MFSSLFLTFFSVQVVWGQAAWINEISYDMTSGDDDDFLEIVAPEGTNMSVYGILLINGSGDKAYDYVQLSGTISSTNAQDGHGFLIAATKVRTLEVTEAKADWAVKGWRTAWAPARLTDALGSSGGVVMGCRKY